MKDQNVSLCSVRDHYRCLPPEEYVLFFDRLALVRKCKQLTGAELTTRTNVLLVRQSLLTPGNGVVFTYKSKKTTKRSQHQGENPSTFVWKRAPSDARLPLESPRSADCDVQLFSPSGIFENPTTSHANRSCRVLINAPPSVKIQVQALHIGFNATSSQSAYIMVNTHTHTHFSTPAD